MRPSTTTLSSPLLAPVAVPLPPLSDAAAAEVYLFIEHLYLLFESHYGDQINRHFERLNEHNLVEPQFPSLPEDPPF